MIQRQIHRCGIATRRPSAAGYATAGDLDLTFDDAPPGAGEVALIHCADVERERALYTLHTREGAHAALGSPFLYAAALDHAAGILSVPFERLEEMDASAALSPCFILTPGRTGSTLLVRLLGACGHRAASEPDVFTQLCCLETGGQLLLGQAVESALAMAAVASLARHLGPSPFIKLRSQCNVRPEVLAHALPRARLVLLLRRRQPWALSRWRAFAEPPWWIATVLAEAIAAYDRLACLGRAPEVMWYEELVADPAAMLGALLPGLPIDGGMQRRIAGVMRRDSQAGTGLARGGERAGADAAAFLSAFEAAWAERREGAATSFHGRALAEALDAQR